MIVAHTVNMQFLLNIPLFLANIRGWQLVIILMALLILIVIPGLLGFRIGRRTLGNHQRKRRKK